MAYGDLLTDHKTNTSWTMMIHSQTSETDFGSSHHSVWGPTKAEVEMDVRTAAALWEKVSWQKVRFLTLRFIW